MTTRIRHCINVTYEASLDMRMVYQDSVTSLCGSREYAYAALHYWPHYFAAIDEDDYRYQTLCQECLEHPDLPLLVLSYLDEE